MKEKSIGDAMQMVSLLAMLMILLCGGCAAAETLTLPADMIAIKEEAFADCVSITEVTIPAKVMLVGTAAFRGCTALKDITVTSPETILSEAALADCATTLWLHCPAGSAAVAYARANHIDYDAGTHYRALIIGQNYTGTNMILFGPTNDARAVRFCLTEMETTAWTVTQKTNLTAQNLLSVIGSTFATATENDVSLLYYSGHGDTDGSLIGSDLGQVRPESLRQQMDAIPGRKIVIVDACYSGQMIAEKADLQMLVSQEDFCGSFLSAFARRSRGALNADDYFVVAAAGPRELSEEGSVNSGTSSKVLGFFTYCLCQGLGWDSVTSRAGSWLADLDGNGAVSIPEAAVYASRGAQIYNKDQHAVWWPQDSTWFAPFRK